MFDYTSEAADVFDFITVSNRLSTYNYYLIYFLIIDITRISRNAFYPFFVVIIDVVVNL